MSDRIIYRTAIPVDDGTATVEMTGPIIHVATRREDLVEVWHIYDPAIELTFRTFRVYGTGHSGVEGKHVGTAITPSGRFVWHLFEVGP